MASLGQYMRSLRVSREELYSTEPDDVQKLRTDVCAAVRQNGLASIQESRHVTDKYAETGLSKAFTIANALYHLKPPASDDPTAY